MQYLFCAIVGIIVALFAVVEYADEEEKFVKNVKIELKKRTMSTIYVRHAERNLFL